MVVEASRIETISILGKVDAIHVGYNLIQGYIAQDIISSINNVSNYVVVTDNNLAPLYLETLMSSIQSCLTNNQRILVRILPSGEQSKSRETKAGIEDFLLNSSCTRDTCLIALGGGVIGDLVGYVASTFMRGIPFVQIPTTLLAMVDSSIGGKTAIDTPHGKNLIGTFWQPKRIYLDLSVLNTLPKREIANGMAEVIKTAAISSEEEFLKIENGRDKINAAMSMTTGEASDLEFLASVICACANFKADVVTRDEREGGLRGLLNFGHSIGHAFEAILSPEWLHGECVSIGLVLEAQLSCNLGHCSPEVVHRLANCLHSYGLPIAFDVTVRNKLHIDQVMNTMKIDKKNKGSQKRIVLLSAIGETLEQKASDVPDNAVENVIIKHAAIETSPILDSNTITHQQQHLIPHPHINITSASVKLDKIVTGLYDILNKRFQCTLITSQNKAVESSEDNDVHVYFTEKPGSTISQYKNWYEYVVLENEMDYHFYNGAMAFITDSIYCQKQRHIDPSMNKSSTFVTLTIPSYASVLPVVMNQWLENTDAIEYRVDLLDPQTTDEDWIAKAGKELAHLRQRTKLPIVYTVRTSPQAGKFNPTKTKLYADLVHWGHRWGCDYVDLELTTLSEEDLDQAMILNRSYPTTKIVASFHDPKHLHPWSSLTMQEVYQQASQLFHKYSHDGVIKMVGFAETFYDNIELEQFRHQVDPENNCALILINMGPHGKFSRAANRFLSPATHPALPSVAAPGQLAVSQLSHIRQELNME